MEQTTYWVISISLGAVALLISLGSVILGLWNRAEQRRFLLLSKKTEVLTKLVEARAKLNHLTMIYAQNLQFIQHMGSPESLGPEAARIRNNLDLIIEKSSIAESNYNLLINIKTSNIEELEKWITVANSFIVHATEELEKEQKVFHDLRQSLAQ